MSPNRIQLFESLKQLSKADSRSQAEHSGVDTDAHGSTVSAGAILATRGATRAARQSLSVVGRARFLALDGALRFQAIEETTEFGNVGSRCDGHGTFDVVELGDLHTIRTNQYALQTNHNDLRTRTY